MSYYIADLRQAGRRRSDPDGENYDRDALVVKSSLDGEDSVVVEKTGQKRRLGEHELATEENGVREAVEYLGRKTGDLVDDVSTEGRIAGCVVAVTPHILNIKIQFLLHFRLHMVHLLHALEVPGINDADLDEDEIPEGTAEEAD